MTDDPPVLVTRDAHVMQITLNRPRKRNAIDRVTAEALDDALNELDDDPELRVGMLAANGPVFCAGSDVNAIGDYLTVRGGEYGLLRRRRSTPLIAVVEGPAVGGGMEIVLACDLVVASPDAHFSLPEVSRGLVPGLAVFASARALPLNIAREMQLTGDPLGPERAYDIGFVNRLAERGDARRVAGELAERITRNAPASVSAALQATNDFVARDESLGWAFAERARLSIADSDDAAEGVAAFLEKRPPAWRGR